MTIAILNEHERPEGPAFTARVAADDHAPRLVEVRLSWADYNLFAPDGTLSPERVALAALAYLIDRTGVAALPESFDVSTLRRRFPGADEAVRRKMR